MVRLTCELLGQQVLIDAHDTLRIIIYWDTQTNGTASNIGEILVNTAGNGIEYNSFRNLFRGTRFKIIYDKHYNFTSPVYDSDSVGRISGQVIKTVWIYKNMNVPITYSQVTTPGLGKIVELQENSLWVVAIAKHGRVRVQGKYRIRYQG